MNFPFPSSSLSQSYAIAGSIVRTHSHKISYTKQFTRWIAQFSSTLRTTQFHTYYVFVGASVHFIGIRPEVHMISIILHVKIRNKIVLDVRQTCAHTVDSGAVEQSHPRCRDFLDHNLFLDFIKIGLEIF